MKMKIIVLGSGLVGNLIARDLSSEKNVEITIADVNEEVLNKMKTQYNIEGIKADLSKSDKLTEIVKDKDLVVNALPGFLGYKALKTVLNAKKNVVDISFFAEDPFTLDEIAKKNEVFAVIDAGVAPGLSNIVAGRITKIFDEVFTYKCLVGGLPRERFWPFEYKAPFSPSDVIEEYTRPARLKINGKTIIKEALSDVELVDIEGLGTLEAFNTDGLRTLLKTLNMPTMIEKTLRYPGHTSKIKM